MFIEVFLLGIVFWALARWVAVPQKMYNKTKEDKYIQLYQKRTSIFYLVMMVVFALFIMYLMSSMEY